MPYCRLKREAFQGCRVIKYSLHIQRNSFGVVCLGAEGWPGRGYVIPGMMCFQHLGIAILDFEANIFHIRGVGLFNLFTFDIMSFTKVIFSVAKWKRIHLSMVYLEHRQDTLCIMYTGNFCNMKFFANFNERHFACREFHQFLLIFCIAETNIH